MLEGQRRLDAHVRQEVELSRRPRDRRRPDSARTGVAFASKYKGTDQVTLCFFGEAAVNQGAFHESLNMAQLWKLPCIYICENNQYGMGTSLERAMSLHDIAQKACAYEMASEFVDGMDVLAVREATQRAVERARKDYLPTLLEVRTYRFMGHSMSDPGNYRTRAEIEKYQERDPIKLFSASLLEEKIVDDEDSRRDREEVREEVERLVAVCRGESAARRRKSSTPTSTPIRLTPGAVQIKIETFNGSYHDARST